MTSVTTTITFFRFGLPFELVVEGDFVDEGAGLAGRLAVVGAVGPVVRESAGLVDEQTVQWRRQSVAERKSMAGRR